MRRFLCLACLMCACVVIGCSDEGPLLTGHFRGVVQDSLAGSGTLTITIVQDGQALRGTWQRVFADPANNTEGNLTGTIQNPSDPHPSISMLLQPANATSCPLQITATLRTPAEMIGTYTSVNCGHAVNGTLDVTRL